MHKKTNVNENKYHKKTNKNICCKNIRRHSPSPQKIKTAYLCINVLFTSNFIWRLQFCPINCWRVSHHLFDTSPEAYCISFTPAA